MFWVTAKFCFTVWKMQFKYEIVILNSAEYFQSVRKVEVTECTHGNDSSKVMMQVLVGVKS